MFLFFLFCAPVRDQCPPLCDDAESLTIPTVPSVKESECNVCQSPFCLVLIFTSVRFLMFFALFKFSPNPYFTICCTNVILYFRIKQCVGAYRMVCSNVSLDILFIPWPEVSSHVVFRLSERHLAVWSAFYHRVMLTIRWHLGLLPSTFIKQQDFRPLTISLKSPLVHRMTDIHLGSFNGLIKGLIQFFSLGLKPFHSSCFSSK